MPNTSNDYQAAWHVAGRYKGIGCTMLRNTDFPSMTSYYNPDTETLYIHDCGEYAGEETSVNSIDSAIDTLNRLYG